LTFTRKAASELRSRLHALGLEHEVTAGTFHAIALAELRRRAIDTGRTPPVLIDSKGRILAQVLDDIDQAGGGTDRGDVLAALAAEVEWAKARLISPSDYVEAARSSRRLVEGFRLSAVAEIYSNYEATKRRRGAVDFDDLLIDLADEIARDANFAAAQRWRFRHLFVDELQDANRAQLRLLDAWLGERADLFAVGDASQAIYGWNGADASGVTDFASHYSGATVLTLEANYRSTPQLVAVAKSVLPRTHVTEPVTTPRDDGLTPSLVAYASGEDEADAIATAIHAQRNRGRRYSECAVLTRTNAQLVVIEQALEIAGIPIAVRGSNGFLARHAVREALRPIANSTQPAQFSQWRKDLPAPRPTRRGRPQDTADEDVTQIALAKDQADRTALVDLADEYVRLDPLPQGRGFVAFLRQSLGADPAPVAEDAVDVATFHRAKGLEWKVVFVAGLEDGFVPNARATTKEALEEERRLLYVALSRAEDELHCSWARTRLFGTHVADRSPSPYVDAIEAANSKLTGTVPHGADTARRALAKSRALLQRDP
jgi:DNA helicase-2/ATP-dependent DNA helicase PcrA